MQEMLLQSWGKRLRIFPAVPKAWPDVQFHQLRGEGAFLVSDRRELGQTKWALIESEAGGSVEVEAQIANAQWIASKGITVKPLGEGVSQIGSPLMHLMNLAHAKFHTAPAHHILNIIILVYRLLEHDQAR